MGCASIPCPAISACATQSSSRTPSSESSSTATTSCRTRAQRRRLLFDEPRLARHVAHALRFLLDLGGLLLGAGVRLQDAERGEPRRDRRRLDRLLYRAGQGLARVLGDTGGGEKAEPDTEQLLRVAQLAQRRDVGNIGNPARCYEAAERTRLDVRAERAER